ncbi:MAG: 7-carboxy-7-deazaguanine synthase QueE [Chitinophagaceae bacterium]
METFYTLQGEGFHQGKAAYFIRIGGCDVGCVWCDVKKSWDAHNHPILLVEEIVRKAVEIVTSTANPKISFHRQHLTSNIQHPALSIWQPASNICVITGGEPLLHNLDELTYQLHHANFQTHLETSGSSSLSGEWDWICLSPKKFKAPLPEILPLANELKIIIYNRSDFDWAEKFAAQTSANCKLYLQPEWSKISIIMPLIIDYIKQNSRWQLSLQIHKYINVP